MSTVSGTMHVQNGCTFKVISIDKRWRDGGKASVLVESTAANEPPTRQRLYVSDTLVVHLDIHLHPEDNGFAMRVMEPERSRLIRRWTGPAA
jgi:hypothetical protein